MSETYDEQTVELRHIEVMAAIIYAGALTHYGRDEEGPSKAGCVLIARELVKKNRGPL